MNIIEKVKHLLSEYPHIKNFSNGIEIDYTSNKPDNFGLYSVGDTLVNEDVVGNQERKHSFVLNATHQSMNNFERLANSTFLLELGYWLEKVKDVPVTVLIGEETKNAVITSLSSANAMAYSVPTGKLEDGITYQLQIYANYNVESEDF